METNLSSSIRQQRELDKFSEFKIAFEISAIKLIGPLFPIFFIADILSQQKNLLLFFILRISVTAYSFLLYYKAKNLKKIEDIELYSLLLLFYPSCIISALIYISNDGVGSIYFVGLNLISAGAICFFPWAITKLPLVILAVYAPLYSLLFLTDFSKGEAIKLIINSFFIIGSILISCVIRLIYEQLKLKEVDLRIKLNNELINRKKIIEQKTQEAINLSNLTKQFSPQVVHAIKNNEINIDGKIYESDICVVFIDIVNSTERVRKISKENLNAVITKFMNDTMSILLKYDITIDKFLGDGVLAFSNAPIKKADYIKRVINASVEIRSKIQHNIENYNNLWGKNFEIKIGIDVGSANVGFFGNSDAFKSYTAIGEVVNLASRISGACEPFQILVSKNTYLLMEDDPTYSFSQAKDIYLKGFESNNSIVYEVNSEVSSIDLNVYTCPRGHGILNLELTKKGIYVFQCRSCGYELSNSVKENKKRAA